ncbi:MAG: helix-hairpin-helix domain-containing protein [Gammaproteobacteria bacterium]|nr:helix-hairpin-helix domain-containing protein [Gammaproteobacteria bacterium]
MSKKLFSALAAGTVALVFSTTLFAAKVNINTADAEALAEGIVGVGPEIADRIVQWREENGPFSSVDDLAEVRGIGEATIEKNRENLTIEASSE